MDIKDLKVFHTIAKEESIAKASRILYMTPQGISKIVKNLEAEMGCRLFTRNKSGMLLTESGKRFLEYADKDIADYYQVKKDILHIEQRQKKVVDLLSAYGIIRMVTPDCIAEFCKKYPDIEFHYREYPDLQAERLFAENEGNVAFSIGEFDEELYHVVPLETFPIKLLVNEQDPLSEQESVTIEDLKNRPLYIESSQFAIYHLIMKKCEEAGFQPDIAFQTSGFSLCHKMVKENKGISVTVDFVFDDMKEQGLRLIPFSDDVYEWKACMITRKEEAENEAMLLKDLEGEKCELEMIAGGCDADCHRRRFRTKLIAMGMCGYDRVIVEPSGIYDVDEFFDVLRDDPIDRWYEIGNVITVVDAKLESDLSDEADYLLASEAANAGCIVLSRSQEATEEEIKNTIEHLNHAMEKVQCNRRFRDEIFVKDWETFESADYEKLLACGYVPENYRKMHIEEGETFKSLYFMNLDKTKNEIIETAEKIFADKECGKVFRIKGFLMDDDDKWMELNATHQEMRLEPITEGQKVVIVIGENLNEQRIGTFFA